MILAHHHALLREGLAALLEAGEYQVVAQADNGSDILSLVEQHSPNMVLMEWKAPGVDEFLIRELAGLSSGPVVVLMTRPESSDELGGSLQAGVSGCLSVNLSAKDFLRALRILAEGDLVVSHEMAAALLDPEDGRANAAGLTPRELEVLRLVAEGATNREIGQELLISQHTAKVHVRRVLSKLGLRNRQQAAAYAASQGLTR
ncbi:MAG: response regulator transcription factor [Thermoleophilia bacterium]|nr:response regulator transcription factor [Thermoleophilia bacterium]